MNRRNNAEDTYLQMQIYPEISIYVKFWELINDISYGYCYVLWIYGHTIFFFLTETFIIIYVWVCELQSSTAHPVGRWPALTPPHHSGAVMRHFLHRARPSVEKKTADGRLCTLQYMRPFSRSLSLGSFLFFFFLLFLQRQRRHGGQQTSVCWSEVPEKISTYSGTLTSNTNRE